MSATTYGTSPVKRIRRTHGEIDDVLRSILNILVGEENQITIRHLFYRLVGLRVIEKTEPAYKSLCSHLSKWRRSGKIPWDAFTDSTRWHIHRRTYDGVHDALSSTVEAYRRNLWDTQSSYVEVWVEKDAIAAIVSDVANSFGVPVFVARGFASLSSLYDAATTFRVAIKRGKDPTIYHFGDYDPSGVAAGEAMLTTFRDDLGVDLQFIRAAVTAEQIQEMGLPTRPVKSTDGRAKNWTGGECVEIDTMPPAEIRRLVESCITRHIDTREWDEMLRAEELERETLRTILASA